ncbi:hypothetical protein [uncultured Christiangramia sp.]|uniref:hypothetical protein n=1 Tax=Christiangramia sp. 3-2217-3z TaxID=3417564 RepID=UPI00261A32CA|nr:hypothetical protein [uncultured Christiangramia sp.]
MNPAKFLLLFPFLVFIPFLTIGQEISYYDLNTSSQDLKNFFLSSNEYFSGGTDDLPYFQGKIDNKYIKFYNSTGVIAIIDFKDKNQYLELVRQIQENAFFQYKVCTDPNSNITYNYRTALGNAFRFNFNEMRISLEFPSEINNLLDKHSYLQKGFVCISEDAYAFHTNIQCEGLGNCTSDIAKTNLREAKNYGYKYCEICTDDSYSKQLLKESLGYYDNSNHSNYQISDIDLTFVKKYESEYMFQEICETEPLKSDLKRQFGAELYDKFINYIAVQGPLEINNNKALLSSCMAHACGIYMSSLFINFGNNTYYAGLLNDEEVYVISNNINFNSQDWSTFPDEFAEWTRDALKDANSNK